MPQIKDIKEYIFSNYKSQGYSTKVLGCVLFNELRKKYPSLFKKYPSD